MSKSYANLSFTVITHQANVIQIEHLFLSKCNGTWANMVFTTFLLQVYYHCKSIFSSSFSLNFSSQDLNEDEKSLLIKGPSFFPVPRDINRLKLLEDWEKFKNSLEVQFSSTIIIITMILNLLITVSLSFPPLRKSQAGRLPCPGSHSLNYF